MPIIAVTAILYNLATTIFDGMTHSHFDRIQKGRALIIVPNQSKTTDERFRTPLIGGLFLLIHPAIDTRAD